MPQNPMMALWPLSFCAFLTACAANDPRPVAVIKPVIPWEQFVCRDLPRPPANGPRLRQSDVAAYLVDLWESGADCKRKNEGLVGLVR